MIFRTANCQFAASQAQSNRLCYIIGNLGYNITKFVISKEKIIKNNIVEYNGILGTIGTLALVVILLSIFAGCATATKFESFEKANILDSTVHLVLKDAEGKSLEIGSGFFVRPGMVVTNLYVVEGANSGYAKLVGKETEHRIEGITRIGIAGHGLALLKVLAPGVNPLPFGDSNIVRGSPVYVVKTSPELNKGQFVKGIATDRLVDNHVIMLGKDVTYAKGDKIIHGPYSYIGNIEWRRLRLTTQMFRESSGVPVLNSRDEIIGVFSHRGGTSGETGNFAITLKTLKTFLLLTEEIERLENEWMERVEKIKNKQ